MFENYYDLSAEEKAQVKAIHVALRAITHSREGNLAWAFVRGLPYKRVERKTRTQTLGTGEVIHHNPPSAAYITHILGTHIPGFAAVGASIWYTKPSPAVEAWLKDPAGAIPLPAPRERKPFVRSEVA